VDDFIEWLRAHPQALMDLEEACGPIKIIEVKPDFGKPVYETGRAVGPPVDKAVETVDKVRPARRLREGRRRRRGL
jgi:hypothetical protein